ncbi:MAG: hypothetical protein LKI80_15885 [Sporolactobacillus sp.]|nr:hypothetical protein [Sporolactobacillus sp.]
MMNVMIDDRRRADSRSQRCHLAARGSAFMLIDNRGEPLTGIHLQHHQYLVFRLHNTTAATLTLQIDFFAQLLPPDREPQLSIAFDLLPQTDVAVPVDTDDLNSRRIFPERTPGRLRMMVSGKPLAKQTVKRIYLRSRRFNRPRTVDITDAYLSDQPDAAIYHPQTLIDELGQWAAGTWPGKVADRDALNRQLREKAARAQQLISIAGKLAPFDLRPAATGWFRTEKRRGRWWLIDPHGRPFISVGVDCISPGIETRIDVMLPYVEQTLQRLDVRSTSRRFDFARHNLVAAFGTDHWRAAWTDMIKTDLQKWRMNTIGNWSSAAFISQARMPYVLPLDQYAETGFPHTQRMLFRDFPDVFATDYARSAANFARALRPFTGDQCMIGYFMRNEPAWAFVYGLNLAEEMLADPVPSASKREFIRRLRAHYRTIAAFNRAWQLQLASFADLQRPIAHAALRSAAATRDLKQFSAALIRRYVEVPARACRRVDPHHLNLGMRYSYIVDRNVLAGADCFDVFSVNCYQESPTDVLNQVGRRLDKPVMIGEFHFGALDRGLSATGIRAAADQTERGKAYRFYVEQAAAAANFVGAHYFMLTDESCLGRFDGENYQIGLLDGCWQKYTEMTAAVAAANRRLGLIHDGRIAPTETRAKLIPAVFC